MKSFYLKLTGCTFAGGNPIDTLKLSVNAGQTNHPPKFKQKFKIKSNVNIELKDYFKINKSVPSNEIGTAHGESLINEKEIQSS